MFVSRVTSETNGTALSLVECYGGIHLGTETWSRKKDDEVRNPQKALGTLFEVRGTYTSSTERCLIP